MKTYYTLGILLFLNFVAGNAQVKPLLHYSFDAGSGLTQELQNEIKNSPYIHAGYTSSYTKGISGYALDLSDEVGVRIPVRIEPHKTPDYTQSFAVSVWVKTKPGARQGTPIISSQKTTEPDSTGWMLGTNDRGAWFFRITDGEHSYLYQPTAERQAINDGLWHHLVVSVDRKKNEIWFYFDGKNVGIYNTETLLPASGKAATVIGGSDEYTDWGSRSEWTAFNGIIDEVMFWSQAISVPDVEQLYSLYATLPPQEKPMPELATLKTQVWNIWHGGRRYGQHVGVSRIIDVLKQNDADIIGLIETYGSGEIIADSLGYYFYLISSNLSIMSRYPIEETIKVYRSFFSGGVILNLGEKGKLAFFDIWLHASPDVCELIKGESVIEELLEKEKPLRVAAIEEILKEIQPHTRQAEQIPVIVMGDFNCGSHLDWTEESKSIHYGMTIDWPVSRRMLENGFTDSFRELNPNPVMQPGFTWSPLINPISPDKDCIHDRIDFIYYKGNRLIPYESKTIDQHAKFWPSDHASVMTSFYLK